MSKKLKICAGNSCKKAGTNKKIKKWVKELDISNQVKKSKCLSICKEGYAIKYNGETYSCQSKEELEKIVGS
jgi:NADH:ubiquinone oxidoreductase subunit E